MRNGKNIIASIHIHIKITILRSNISGVIFFIAEKGHIEIKNGKK